MADIQSTVFIKKPVQEIFEYVSSMENMPEIMPNIVKIEKAEPGPLKPGDIVTETRLIRGRETNSTLEVTRLEENKYFAYRSNINGLQSTYRYSFEAVEGGTWVSFAADIKTTGFVMNLTKRFLVGMISREDGYQLENLKEALENSDNVHAE